MSRPSSANASRALADALPRSRSALISSTRSSPNAPNAISVEEKAEVEDESEKAYALTRAENIDDKKLMSMSDKEIDTVVTDILENLGLMHVADTLMGGSITVKGGLSGGEKKRVQCGVELVTNPEIVVL